MPETPDWNQLLEAGRQFGTMTRAEAERRVQELVRRGELAQERFQAAVDELLERSRSAADDLRGVVRSEIRRQMRALGLVTREDLERLETRLGGDRGRSGGSARKATAKKSPAKKTAAKKATAKKSTAKKSTAKKSTAKKSTATKSTAKKSGAKKTAAKRGRGGVA
jgi:polyhydroxyalkanoate synthesis regulator phasin